MESTGFIFNRWMAGCVAPFSLAKHQMHEDHPLDFDITLLRNHEGDEEQPCAI